MAQKIVITGGSSGIGLESARAFLAQGEVGDHIIICARDANTLRGARAELEAIGPGKVSARVLDVTDQAAVEALFEEVGPLDVLVAAAGVCEQARLDDEQSDQVWHRAMNINVHGVYN